MDRNNLVSKLVVMGDFCTFQRQFETFLKMYQEEDHTGDHVERENDRAAYEAKQPEVTTWLEELTREFF